MPNVRVIQVSEDETVEIQWYLKNKTIFITRHTVPPKATREHKEEKKRRMKAFLWRILYAAICFVLFWWVFPLFLQVLNVPVNSALLELMKVVTAAIAILYVLFGPPPPAPF